MIQPAWTTLHHGSAGGIDVQLRRYDLPRPAEFVVHEPRPILSLMLHPFITRRIGRYEGAGAHYHGLGNIVFTPAAVDCRFRGEGGHPLVLSLMFDDSLFDRVTRLGNGWSNRQLLATFDLGRQPGTHLDWLMRCLAREIEMPGFAADTMIEGTGLMALAELARQLGAMPPAPPPCSGRLSQAQLQRIESCVMDMPGTAPTISVLARQCEMGPRRFTTLFRQTTGQSVRLWVEGRRMDKARQLLLETRLPIKRIAFELGFASQAVFSMAFRRHCGTTPSKYRIMQDHA